MNELVTYASYEDYRAAVGTELNKSAESFVRIGYLLKLARDTNILEGKYDSVNDFAQKEFGLDKTMVSRFIHINDRFSEGGNSERLLEQYQGFGYAKLTLMLQLPDGLNEALTPEYSKSEIQALKEEMDEEKKVSDIEVYLEAPQPSNSTLFEICKEIFKDKELYRLLWCDAELDEKGLLELLAPVGSAIHMVRIPGMGRLSVVFNAEKEYAVITSMRSGETQKENVSDILQEVKTLIHTGTLEESYEFEYGVAYAEQKAEPPKEEKVEPVAPVQPKPLPKKESKVKKAVVPQKSEAKEEPKEIPDIEVIDLEKEVADVEVVSPEEIEVLSKEDTAKEWSERAWTELYKELEKMFVITCDIQNLIGQIRREPEKREDGIFKLRLKARDMNVSADRLGNL